MLIGGKESDKCQKTIYHLSAKSEEKKKESAQPVGRGAISLFRLMGVGV